ncbi:hypothetical protein GCM10017779_52900 [Streptomyces capillispiralis]|nr:hypothetical protein GCM10017779_52900 [Streptomyces capillispiralis]
MSQNATSAGATLTEKVRTVSYDSRRYSAVTADRTVSRCGYPCSTGPPFATSHPRHAQNPIPLYEPAPAPAPAGRTPARTGTVG